MHPFKTDAEYIADIAADLDQPVDNVSNLLRIGSIVFFDVGDKRYFAYLTRVTRQLERHSCRELNI